MTASTSLQQPRLEHEGGVNSHSPMTIQLNAPTTTDANEEYNLTQETSENQIAPEAIETQQTATNTEERIYTKPWNFGGPTHTCRDCGAIVWAEECVKKSSTKSNLKFGICCQKGKIKLPLLQEPPQFLKDLLGEEGPQFRRFKEKIRLYNSIFAFTSMGGKVDNSINQGNSPYVFRLNGQNHHKIGSLLPPNGQQPRFTQLYIYDTQNEVSNRIKSLGNENRQPDLDPDIVHGLTEMFDQHNPLTRAFRMAKDRFEHTDLQSVRIRLIGTRAKDGRQYNLPTCSEVAALIVGTGDNEKGHRDVIIEDKSQGLKRISELHPSFMAMQYPILFPYGEDGYHTDIAHADADDTIARVRKMVTIREYYAYRFMQRENESTTRYQLGRLNQQFKVDAFTCLQETRLDWVRANQKKIRKEVFSGLTDAVSRGDTRPASIGQRIVLPSSFTGSPRFMIQNYHDALAICRWAGPPDIFVTFTCNPRWPEITEFLSIIPGQRPEDRPDVIVRVFKIKLDEMMVDLTKKNHFGRTKAAIYTIEFQKRGLPHAHILLFLAEGDKPRTPEDIDRIICAELPDLQVDPIAHATVVQNMTHGPCGPENEHSPCMQAGRCSKYFPKKFNQATIIGDDGYPVYRRRDDGKTAIKNGQIIDNTFIVPYNVDLLVKFQAHINVEICNKYNCTKYLFKYMNKGPDMALASIGEPTSNEGTNDNQTITDEIQSYLKCRYVSAAEACWRIFAFPTQYKEPSVERMSIHLENQQSITFLDEEPLDQVLDRVGEAKTQFTEWMETNRQYADARKLSYHEFPMHWVWQRSEKKWKKREKGFSIGRIYYAHPASGAQYYLRMLLNIIKGPTSYKDIRTVNNVEYGSFKEACNAMGLLEGDNEWHEAMSEAARWATAHQLRDLFITMLLFCEVSNPRDLWDKHWKDLSDDILFRQQQRFGNINITLTDNQIQNYALCELETALNINHRTLAEFPDLPFPDITLLQQAINESYEEEMGNTETGLEEEAATLEGGLNTEQRNVYQTILSAAYQKEGKLYFVYGSGGTGKTYLWRSIISRLQCQRELVIAVASSGIAALLLPNGRTAHSRFHIPINLNERSTCFVSQGSRTAMMIRRARLIIWDEAPMVHRHAFEAMDRTFRDIMQSDVLFGGKTVVLGGDFRQILPVVPRKGREDVIAATITKSRTIWPACTIFRLTTNMRLRQNAERQESQALEEFSKWILDLGEGKLPTKSKEGEDEPMWIKMPSDLVIDDTGDKKASIVHEIHPDLISKYGNIDYLAERAILTPRNEWVDEINNHILSMLPGEEHVYKSADRVCPLANKSTADDTLYPPEYLNTLEFAGIPNHEIRLKVGSPIILLRNIMQRKGLCNGTRLIVSRLDTRVIQAKVVTGTNIGEKVPISRVEMTPTDSNLPFTLKRRQFPIRVCFAMTINKSQGQTFNRVGLYLPHPVFSHGQLYVAVSRVTCRSGIRMSIGQDGDTPEDNTLTKNVVYKEIFADL